MGSLATSDDRTLLVLGAGPGISRSIALLFASKRYANVVLVARRAQQLQVEKEALELAVGGVRVKTYAVDLVDTQSLLTALDNADSVFGKPEAIFYNAARVLPSELFVHPVGDIEYDLKVLPPFQPAEPSCQSLTSLVKLPKVDPSSHPALIVTSSALPHHPIPQFFALSLVKAAQRNMVQSLHLTYAPKGVHVGVVNVGGPVSPDNAVWNPPNIANKAWEWFEGAGWRKGSTFEVEI